MKICVYCDGKMNNDAKFCPHCGAEVPGEQILPNQEPQREPKPKTPTTIGELEEWYRAKRLPPYEVTRFFIGQNYRKPRAFGIYQDAKTGLFVVYKNKADGTRAVRYEGPDEAHAVKELHERLKQEITLQKQRNGQQRGVNYVRRTGSNPRTVRTVGVVAAIALFTGILGPALWTEFNEVRAGYYRWEDTVYCAQEFSEHRRWFRFDNGSGVWTEADTLPGELESRSSADDYYLGEDYDTLWAYDYGFWDFEDTELYQDYSDYYYEYESSREDDDDDYSWDSGDSWDSWDTDWDSDW